MSVEWKDVTSSNVAAVAWRQTSTTTVSPGDLLVRFRNGSVYKYMDVPREVYRRLLAAPSVGRAVNAWLKGVYECRQVDADSL